MNVLTSTNAVLNRRTFLILALVPLLIGLLCLIIMMASASIQTKKQQAISAQQATLLTQLQQVNDRVTSLSAQIQQIRTHAPQETNAITQQLADLQNSLVSANPQQKLQQLQDTLVSHQQTTTAQLQTLQNTVKQLKQRVLPPHYLSPSTLPFRAISVDIWNGEPQATIRIAGNTALMAQNDVRANWKLTSIAFAPPQAIFQNTHNQFVKVSL